MKAWKRNILLVYIVCLLVTCSLYLLWLVSPNAQGLLETFQGFLVFKIVFAAVGVIALCGVPWCLYVLMHNRRHSLATLQQGDSGSFSIETSALVSLARRALQTVPGLGVQDVAVEVMQKKDKVAIDAHVVAAPVTDEISLVTLAADVRQTLKDVLESFTGQPVRYVSVNFMEASRKTIARTNAIAAGTVTAEGEPRGAEAAKAAADGVVAVDAGTAEEPHAEISEPAAACGGEQAACAAVPASETAPKTETAPEPEPEPAPEPAYAPEPAGAGAQVAGGAAAAPKESFGDRFKRLFARKQSSEYADEDIVASSAVIQDVITNESECDSPSAEATCDEAACAEAECAEATCADEPAACGQSEPCEDLGADEPQAEEAVRAGDADEERNA